MFNGARVRNNARGRGRFAALCLLFFLTVLASGCGAVLGSSGGDYFKSLEKWSRGEKIYQGFEARLYINATYKTADFRKAYIERYATSYELGPDHIKALSEREAEQAEAYNEFFFTAYTPDQTLNDFERRESVWQLYIEDPAGNRARPISITAIDGSEPVIREFFPYFDLWSKAYTVRFPKYADTGGELSPEKGPVKLVITGVMGKGELEWHSGK